MSVPMRPIDLLGEGGPSSSTLYPIVRSLYPIGVDSSSRLICDAGILNDTCGLDQTREKFRIQKQRNINASRKSYSENTIVQ